MEKTGGAALAVALSFPTPPPALLAFGQPLWLPGKLEPSSLEPGSPSHPGPRSPAPQTWYCKLKPYWTPPAALQDSGNARLQNPTVGWKGPGENALGSQVTAGSRPAAVNWGSTPAEVLAPDAGNACQFFFSPFSPPKKFRDQSFQGQGLLDGKEERTQPAR